METDGWGVTQGNSAAIAEGSAFSRPETQPQLTGSSMAASNPASVSDTSKLFRTVNKPKEYLVIEGAGFLIRNVSLLCPFPTLHSVSLGMNKFEKRRLKHDCSL